MDLFKEVRIAEIFLQYSQLLSKFSFEIWNLLKVMLKFAIFNIPTEPWFLSPVISLLVRLSVSSSISLQFLSIDLREKIFFYNYFPSPYNSASIWHFLTLFPHFFWTECNFQKQLDRHWEIQKRSEAKCLFGRLWVNSGNLWHLEFQLEEDKVYRMP